MGLVLAIAHPRKNTLVILQEELRLLGHYGVRLVSVSELVHQPKKIIVKGVFRSIPAKPTKRKAIKPAEEFDVF